MSQLMNLKSIELDLNVASFTATLLEQQRLEN